MQFTLKKSTRDMAIDAAKELESVLEKDDAGNDEVRDAALSAQDALNNIARLLR